MVAAVAAALDPDPLAGRHGELPEQSGGDGPLAGAFVAPALAVYLVIRLRRAKNATS